MAWESIDEGLDDVVSELKLIGCGDAVYKLIGVVRSVNERCKDAERRLNEQEKRIRDLEVRT